MKDEGLYENQRTALAAPSGRKQNDKAALLEYVEEEAADSMQTRAA
jgi:hypothetical protein